MSPLTLHPAARILLLLAAASALPAMSLPALAVTGLATLGLHLRLTLGTIGRLRQGLWRLRWLLLAIFALYGGFTPGEAVHPSLPGLSREGLVEGVRRTLVLIDLLLLVYLMLALTPGPQLVVGLRVLLAPLRRLGADPDRVGLRVALALDAVSRLQRRLRVPPVAGGTSLWTRAAAVIEDIEREANTAGPAVDLDETGRPRWWEWLLPLVLFATLHAIVSGAVR